MSRRRRKRRIMRARLIIGMLLLLTLAAGILFGVFRIKSMEIIGSERHSAEEIREDLVYNFRTENTLYFSWKYRHAATDPRAPYLDSIQAKMLSPGKVRLIVHEKVLFGYIQYAGNNVYFDSKGEVLEITDEEFGGVPLVSGITTAEPVLYQKLPFESTAQLQTMLDITGRLVQENLIPDDISFDENSSITLQFGDVDVKLGQNEYLPEKVANLVSLYPEIAGESGVLNMEAFTGKNEVITLRPKDEASQNTETSGTDEGGDSGTALTETDANGNSIQDGTDEASEAGLSSSDPAGSDGSDTPEGAPSENQETTGVSAFMVFDSSGTLRYDAHVVNGQVVDAYGNPIDGCIVQEDGYVKDAYWNIIDPQTGQLAEQ